MARRPTAEETQAALETFLASLETRGSTPLPPVGYAPGGYVDPIFCSKSEQ